MAWVDLVAADDVKPGHVRKVVIGDLALSVVNCQGDFFVVDDTCTHEDYSLSEGEVFEDLCEIECPKHASSFSLSTGEPTCLPATRPVRVYPVRVEGGRVEADVEQG